MSIGKNFFNQNDHLNPEHPENDLVDEADYANRPQLLSDDLDCLAQLPDPLEQHQKNTESTKQAIWYAFGVPLVTFIVAFFLGFAFKMQGGPYCDAGETTWLCSRTAEVWWPIITSAVAFSGMLGSAWILYDKYRKYLRWRPWMGVLWFLIPFSMTWITSVGTIAIVSHSH